MLILASDVMVQLRVSELVDCHQLSLTNSDMWPTVAFPGCSLVKTSRFFRLTSSLKSLGSLCKAGCYMLKGSLGVDYEGSIISKEDISYHLLMSVCVSL